MATTLADLKVAKFGGIEFPYESLDVDGSYRQHLHQYPHVPGGAREKHGREFYRVTFAARWLSDYVRTSRWAGKDMWPHRLEQLIALFEEGRTEKLFVPTRNRDIYALCTNWKTSAKAQFQNGEDVNLVFEEDQPKGTLTGGSVPRTNMEVQAQTFTELSARLPDKPSIFQQIKDAANKLLAIRDQALMWGGFVESSIYGLIDLIREADATVDLLQDPVNHELVAALRELWAAALDLAENLTGGADLAQWTVPWTMTMTEAAGLIYQDTSRAGDLIGLNAVVDPMNVLVGTTLNYFPDA
jgi:hypothetical protein